MSDIQCIKAVDPAADENVGDIQGHALANPAADEARFELYRIERPHPDIELGVARLPFDYLIRIPDAGLNRDTGLVLFLVPYGMPPCGVYVRKLLSYLANKYNCLAASLAYFGSDDSGAKKRQWILHPLFFAKLKEQYGIEITASKIDLEEIVYRLAVLLARNGHKKLHSDCILMGIAPEYNSMGFLPALDGLQVAHRLIDSFALDKRRIFLLGSSYGGYIASLMVKFAPRTFRMAIDNSGFSSAEDDIWNVYGSSTVRPIAGFAVRTQMVSAFTSHPLAANFFSPARSRVRSLLEPDHVHAGTVRLYGYHATVDAVAPPQKKILLREIYAGRVPYELEMIDESRIDGRIFKEVCHGMRASLRGIFDGSYAKFLRDGGALAEDTDFDRESRYLFRCGKENYSLRFSRRDGVRAEIQQAPA